VVECGLVVIGIVRGYPSCLESDRLFNACQMYHSYLILSSVQFESHLEHKK
jgi:hypothetical protein